MGVGWGQMQGNRKIAISQRLSLRNDKRHGKLLLTMWGDDVARVDMKQTA